MKHGFKHTPRCTAQKNFPLRDNSVMKPRLLVMRNHDSGARRYVIYVETLRKFPLRIDNLIELNWGIWLYAEERRDIYCGCGNSVSRSTPWCNRTLTSNIKFVPPPPLASGYPDCPPPGYLPLPYGSIKNIKINNKSRFACGKVWYL